MNVLAQCIKGHEYEISFDEPIRKECDHDKADKVRGICVVCAMQSTQKDPDSSCPECGLQPARILKSPETKVSIIRG